jgi:long-chain acyl-CoA synthetase
MPGITVDFTSEGEILVKGSTVFSGYYRKPGETAKVLTDGWYHTGDTGKLTESGDLLMIDRINDIFKTSGGKYISPQKVELLLCDDNFIEQAVVIGDNRKYISALIVPSVSRLRNQFGLLGEKVDDAEILVREKAVIDFMKLRIDRLQADLPSYERVVRFTLLPELFSIENEALTATLKIRRRIVEKKFSVLIEEMYR